MLMWALGHTSATCCHYLPGV